MPKNIMPKQASRHIFAPVNVPPPSEDQLVADGDMYQLKEGFKVSPCKAGFGKRLSECSGHRGFESIHNRGKHRCRHVSASVFRVIGQWWFLSIAIVVSFQSPSLSAFNRHRCQSIQWGIAPCEVFECCGQPNPECKSLQQLSARDPACQEGTGEGPFRNSKSDPSSLQCCRSHLAKPP